jgi:hypothetical protein
MKFGGAGGQKGKRQQQGNEQVFGVSKNSHGVDGDAHIGEASARNY